MRRFLHDNSLSIALFLLFLISIIGQAVSGWLTLNEERAMHGQAPLAMVAYLQSGHFLSATFENWESEFLQMAVYVLLTGILFQKGSPESREPKEAESDPDPNEKGFDPRAPWPVRRGGLILKLYAHSLSAAMLILLAISFTLHGAGSTRRMNEEAVQHGQPLKTFMETLVAPEFWYESFQNWQSEFLSVGLLVVLSIFLRERGSPESKPVEAPHSQTGG